MDLKMIEKLDGMNGQLLNKEKEIMRLCKTNDFSYVAQYIVVALHLIISQWGTWK
jgi:hypothetical protein